ncbi:hypothetical protein O3P69_020901 [Scylla paramamosain]|uniref:Uncharacterized protein n=1 Tax=Scylla paramamosain TaxID=85552 RepID=A0AAW0TRR0_SCYPA
MTSVTRTLHTSPVRSLPRYVVMVISTQLHFQASQEFWREMERNHSRVCKEKKFLVHQFASACNYYWCLVSTREINRYTSWSSAIHVFHTSATTLPP